MGRSGDGKECTCLVQNLLVILLLLIQNTKDSNALCSDYDEDSNFVIESQYLEFVAYS